MTRLVSVRQARDQLKHPHDDCAPDEDSLILFIEVAQALVLDYVKQRRSGGEDWETVVDGWTAATVPPQIKAAILYQCAELYRFRGDDVDVQLQERPQGALASMVRMLLDGFRDPTVA